MPIDNDKPPDPLVDEFCILTMMTSADDLCSALFDDTKVKVMKGKHRKAHRCIKVSMSGSARAGSILRRLRSDKITGKARVRAEGSPRDDRGGKRVVSSHFNPEINKVIAYFKSGALNNNLKFAMGCSNNDNIDMCSLNVADYKELCNDNDGSFIKIPLDCAPDIGLESSPVAKSCVFKTSHEHTSMGDVGNTGVGIASSKDDIAIAEIGMLNEKGIAGSGTSNEHTSMEDVVNTGCVFSSSQDGIASYKGGSDFEFGKVKSFEGILKNPPSPLTHIGKNTTNNPFVSKPNDGGVWNNNRSYEDLALKIEYVPSSVSKLENGNRRISFSTEEVFKGGQACSLQLYGYFVGTSMDYRVVRGNLMKMWRVYDIEEITKTNAGMFYFKFKSKEGMKKVLESGPWMIQNVPLVLNIWEPGIWLAKTKPTSISIWVCVYNIPLELCNGNGIGKIMSGVGKPLLMDKMTMERYLKKAGKMDFARVLVEVSVEDDLPNVLEIEYPPLGNRPSRIGMLEVKYQWRPPLCTHCKTFGHSTLSCKIRPRSDDEIATNTSKDLINVNSFGVTDSSAVLNEGFVTVGKKNKPVISQDRAALVKSDNYNNGNMYGIRGKGEHNGRRLFVGNQKQHGNSQGFNGLGNFQRNSQRSNKKNSKLNAGTGLTQGNVGNKPLYQYRNDPNFKPKVLVRGTGSNNNVNLVSDETIPIKNSFNVLSNDGDDTDDMGGINVNDEFESKVWPKLKEEVDILMEAGIYPSKQVRMDWSIHQMDYFYKNCHKFHLDPIIEDDEGDVKSDVEGIAMDMKPEFDVDAVNNSEINTAACDDVSNGYVIVFLVIGVGLLTVPLVLVVRELLDCVEDIKVEDISMTGLRFAWNKKPGKEGGLLKKLDRVLAIPKIDIVKARPFKFHNFLTTKDDFIPVVKRVWCNKVEGFAMFGLVSKLKLLKDYKTALKDEESFLRQKYKVEWLNVGDRNSKYFHNVVKEPLGIFFLNGKLLKEVNATVISLVPKVAYVEDIEGNPFHGNSVGDQFVRHFKSVLGKCSKVSPIKDPSGLFLKKLSGPDALYMVRRVTDEEIKTVLFYIEGNKAPGHDGFSSQFFKDSWNVIGEKAYDSVEWDFLPNCLKFFGFHDIMVKWVMNCVSTASFTINVNGDHKGFFKGMRGLRQGDPLSPYLFTLIIEVLNLVLIREIKKNPSFRYHCLCKEVKLTHLCFADDLLLFRNGDSKSVSIMKNALAEFSGMAGLLPNCSKSTVFFGNVRDGCRRKIL
nr:hypothetical protein [Tanacetum cinerariifolium]